MADPSPQTLSGSLPRYVRFGPFEADLRAGELRKHGIKIRLGPQSFQILRLLMERPGDVVLREEIRGLLWSQDVAVEFESSINSAIAKLREVLNDSAEQPKYIETLPRRGYRFIATLEAPPLETAAIERPSAPPPPVPMRAPRNLAAILVLVAAISAILAVSGYRFWFEPRPKSLTLSLGSMTHPVISPDGSSVLYYSNQGLFLSRTDRVPRTLLYDAEPVTDIAAWSFDGREVLFHSRAGLMKMALPNGPPVMVWPSMGVSRGMSWGRDGTIIAAVLPDLYLIGSNGGKPQRLEVPGITGGFFFPEFLPDGKHILFGGNQEADIDAGIYLASVEHGKLTRAPVLLRRNATAGHFSSANGGSLLYLEDDKLYAQRLDVKRARLEGSPTEIVSGVFSVPDRFQPQFSVSRNGVLAWREGRAQLARLTWFDRNGKELGIVGPPAFLDPVLLSPDESRIIFSTPREGTGLAVAESNRSEFQPLRGLTDDPLWAPDSSTILYPKIDGSLFRLMRRKAVGGSEFEVARMPSAFYLRDLAADGKVVLFWTDGKSGPGLYVLHVDRGEPEFVADAPLGRLSPDGRWVVYSPGRGVSGKSEVYVKKLGGGELPMQISTDGGSRPVWRRDGKEILFLKGPEICSVSLETKGGAILASTPQTLFSFRAPSVMTGDETPLAVTRDGARILVAQMVEQPRGQMVWLTTAWDSRLR